MWVLGCLAALLALGPTQATERWGPGDHRLTLQHGGLTRHYLVHVPPAYRSEHAVPLLMVLHGGGGHMDLQANDRLYGQITESDTRGHVVVFPNGYSALPSGRLATWNAGLCCAAARDRQVDDVGFLKQVVAEVASRWAIDPLRVYATGMSNGGMMAYRLACDAADTFRAVAAVAGTDNTRTCQPSRPVSVLHIHALNDDHVLFHGGAGSASAAKALVTDHRSVPDTVARWTGFNRCSESPMRVLDKAGARCERYPSCAGGSRVQLCTTDTGGHSWPGGHKPWGTSAPSTALSANSVMWGFFDER